MSKRCKRPSTDESSNRHIVRSEYLSGNRWGLASRLTTYDFATKRVVPYLVAYDNLQANPDDTIVDIGSNDCLGLMFMRVFRQHTGTLVGVDIGKEAFMDRARRYSRILERRWKPVRNVVGVGERLPFQNDAIDHVVSLDTLYHSTDRARFLREFRRIGKPAMRHIISTKGTENKLEQRIFEAKIAEYVNRQPPPLYTAPFTTDIAFQELGQVFDDVEVVYHQQCPARFEAEVTDPLTRDTLDGYRVFRSTFDAVRLQYRPTPPTPAQWEEAMKIHVEPVIRQGFDTKGYFDVTIDRVWFGVTKY